MYMYNTKRNIIQVAIDATNMGCTYYLKQVLVSADGFVQVLHELVD